MTANKLIFFELNRAINLPAMGKEIIEPMGKPTKILPSSPSEI